MTTTQELVLAKIAEGVEAAGLTFVRDAEWANTGIIRAFSSDLELLAEVTYDFQIGSCSFRGFAGEPVATCYYGEERRPSQRPAVKSTIPEVIAAVVRWLSADDFPFM